MSKRGIIIGLTILLAGLVAVYSTVVWPVRMARFESKVCVNSIPSICLAAKVWALDHGGVMPTNFLCMSDELSTPKILSCVESRCARSSDWAMFKAEDCTYEILAPGMRVEDTNRVFLRCKLHGHLGYSDTTVFDGIRRHGKFD